MSYEMHVTVVASLDQLFQTPPVPAPWCDVCEALMVQWRRLKNPRHPEFDPSRASDVAVEIRNHPTGKAHE
jgi:hypothetical protein